MGHRTVSRRASDHREARLRLASPWLTAAETAAYLGVARGTIHNWTMQRRIPHIRRGGLVRYHRDALDRWLAAAAQSPADGTDRE